MCWEHFSLFIWERDNMTCACYIFSQSHLVEKAVYELVDTLKAGLADGDKKVLTAEEGYACLMPDHKNKKQRCQDCIACSYYTLLNYFTQRNTEALVKGICLSNIANFVPSFLDTFQLTPSPPELKTI